MSAFDDANDLIRHAESAFADIRPAYDASLHAKAVTGTLRVQNKNFVENLRSAVDFAARGLFHLYGTSPKANPKIYFPYTPGILSRRALPAGRLARLGATPDLHHGLLTSAWSRRAMLRRPRRGSGRNVSR